MEGWNEYVYGGTRLSLWRELKDRPLIYYY